MDDKASRSSAAAVSVAGLSKRYGVTEAVSGVSFEVGAGQIFGLLGPNGAGKTTTLECILGLRQPDSGSIQIDGSDLRTHATRAKLLVGAQLQAATLQDKITPRQALSTLVDSLPHVLGAVCADCGWILDTPAPNRLLAELVRRADQVGAELIDVQLRRPSLEDVFIELTGHSWSGERERRRAS